MSLLDAFLILLNEEELLPYALESFCSLGDLLGTLSIVDNGSTDASLAIVESFRSRLNIVLQHEHRHSHHGKLRNLALEPLTSEWILYLDADETFTSNFAEWLRTSNWRDGHIWEFLKWSTILDRYHHAGGEGPAQRLFKRLPGVHFSQRVHTEPQAEKLRIKMLAQGVYFFDHTSCASREKLIAKGWRYQVHQGEIGIGPWHEYIGRVENAHKLGIIKPLPDYVRPLIFTGPGE